MIDSNNINKNAQIGTMSTIHFPGTNAAEKISTALVASSTNGSGPFGSIVYPYAILRMMAPAFLCNSLSSTVYLISK